MQGSLECPLSEGLQLRPSDRYSVTQSDAALHSHKELYKTIIILIIMSISDEEGNNGLDDFAWKNHFLKEKIDPLKLIKGVYEN